MLSEFDIIRRCFDQRGLAATKDDVVQLGIGDDCALVSVPSSCSLALSMDTLVEGVHFPSNASPADIAWRSLAVNLSDLAAMGASPRFFTLALTLPEANENWLMEFAGGLREIAGRFQCFLAGGDITRGPLTITIQVHGLVETDRAMVRSGAKVGDQIFVTGSLGKAALALKLFDNTLGAVDEKDRAALLEAFYRPLPRVEAGMALAPFVSAGLDISDGLLGDLGHLCEKSACGARVTLPEIPVDSLVRAILGDEKSPGVAASGGDDYELILTVPSGKLDGFLDAARSVSIPVTCIGEITDSEGLVCVDSSGNTVNMDNHSYRHFHGDR